ncbi:MAG TPA: hypothetical protein VFB22_03870 [Candidatus Baltobacteraceae bacterium]|nr:hypothetical protein [Candidatus Baltobacteraceae bacterium]
MSTAVLSRRPAAPIPDPDALASAVRLDADVRAALDGVAPRRARLLHAVAAARYREALAESAPAAWSRFARALAVVLRAGERVRVADATPGSWDARCRLRGFLAENPDLGGPRFRARPVS